jgi:hypothetical protein
VIEGDKRGVLSNVVVVVGVVLRNGFGWRKKWKKWKKWKKNKSKEEWNIWYDKVISREYDSHIKYGNHISSVFDLQRKSRRFFSPIQNNGINK